MRPMKFGVGQPVRRVEDQRFITGAGSYTSDTIPDKALHAFVLRSPYAHATFRFTDLDTAKAMKGVRLVLTHADVAQYGDLPCLATIPLGDNVKLWEPPYPLLADGRVRHVGDVVAFIVADDVGTARDAAEAIGIEWEMLPAVGTLADALAPDAPKVWDELKDNVGFSTQQQGDKDKADKAFAKADRVVGITLNINRLAANFMEPRAVVAAYDKSDKRWTITLGSQGVHDQRDMMSKILKVDPARVRIKTPDVGGGFGTKLFMYREYPLAAIAAEKLDRAVSWVGERTEHFLGDTHGRSNLTHAEMALDKSGKFIGMRVQLDAEMGAYLSQFAPFIPWVGTTMTSGCYDIPAVYVAIRGVYTNTPPIDAYRGAGRPEAAYVVERLVDEVARVTGKSPDKVRAQNFIKPSKMPYKTQTGRVYDSGEFEGHMRRAMEVADWAGFKGRLKASTKAGKMRGIGLASYIEACAGGGGERAELLLEKDGGVTVLIGTMSNGQGHETAYAQIVAQHLDIAVDKVRVVQGDTDRIKSGGGTGGSRSVPVGGAAVQMASAKLAEIIKSLAADALEASVADLEFADGSVRVAGTDKSLTFAQIAALPAATPEKLNAAENWTPPEATYPNGTHVVEVEIDPDTGETAIERYTIVDDFGVTLNPLLLAGQVHGGIVQGIGQALMEQVSFDAEGQIVTASLMDYALPRAGDVPNFHFETRNVPCATNLLGLKGAGEAGAIGACPAIMNAVVDALKRGYGINHIDMPATPARIFSAIAEAQAAR